MMNPKHHERPRSHSPEHWGYRRQLIVFAPVPTNKGEVGRERPDGCKYYAGVSFYCAENCKFASYSILQVFVQRVMQ